MEKHGSHLSRRVKIIRNRERTRVAPARYFIGHQSVSRTTRAGSHVSEANIKFWEHDPNAPEELGLVDPRREPSICLRMVLNFTSKRLKSEEMNAAARNLPRVNSSVL